MKQYKKYLYNGPIYYYGNKIAEKSEYYTMATSWLNARRNFVYKIANGDKAYYYDICDADVVELPDHKFPETEAKRPRFEICGYELNDANECPVCDYGEYDLLD